MQNGLSDHRSDQLVAPQISETRFGAGRLQRLNASPLSWYCAQPCPLLLHPSGLSVAQLILSATSHSTPRELDDEILLTHRLDLNQRVSSLPSEGAASKQDPFLSRKANGPRNAVFCWTGSSAGRRRRMQASGKSSRFTSP